MNIQFYNKGNPEQISGGYLYNKYLLAELNQLGVKVEYLSVPKVSAKTQLIVIDSLMIYELASFILQTTLPVVLLIHLPPTIFLDLEAKSAPKRTMLRRIYTKSHIVVTGERSQSYLLENYGIAKSNLSCIEPGILSSWRQKSVYPNLPKRMVCIANFVKGKGHLKMLQMLSKLSDIDWQLNLYGSADMDKEYFQEVMDCVTDLGLQERVCYSGKVAHKVINEVLLQADLLLQFSVFETYSMVIAEAINTRLPVISTRCGAYENFEQSGFVYHVNNSQVDAIAEEIRPLLSDPNRYGTLLKGSMIKTNTWEIVGQQFYQLLQGLQARKIQEHHV